MQNVLYQFGFHTAHDSRIRRRQMAFMCDHFSKYSCLLQRYFNSGRWPKELQEVFYAEYPKYNEFPAAMAAIEEVLKNELRKLANEPETVSDVAETILSAIIGAPVVRAKAYTDEQIEQIRKEAYEEGKNAGYEEGRIAGRKEGLEEADHRINHALSDGTLKQYVDKLSGLPLAAIEAFDEILKMKGLSF